MFARAWTLTAGFCVALWVQKRVKSRVICLADSIKAAGIINTVPGWGVVTTAPSSVCEGYTWTRMSSCRNRYLDLRAGIIRRIPALSISWPILCLVIFEVYQSKVKGNLLASSLWTLWQQWYILKRFDSRFFLHIHHWGSTITQGEVHHEKRLIISAFIAKVQMGSQPSWRCEVSLWRNCEDTFILDQTQTIKL